MSNTPNTNSTAGTGAGAGPALIGHPIGLFVLFFTEMWERFSYYGMRALLVLYLTSELIDGGLGWSRESAGQLYGWYTSIVYITPIIGGMLADRLLGFRRAIVIGGLLMTLGHLSLAFEAMPAFYLGLVLLVLGNGLFKPNISSMVGQLYPDGSPLKDSAYTIFYMGINVGAFLGTLICGYLGENVGWHYGFGAAGIFMAFGLIQFWFSQQVLGNIGLEPDKAKALEVIDDKPLTKVDRDRVIAISIFSFFTIFFWLAFEQAGSSMNIYARDYTDRSLNTDFAVNAFRVIGFLLTVLPMVILTWVFWGLSKNIGRKYPFANISMAISVIVLWATMIWMIRDQWQATSPEVPASWFQSLNAFFIVTLAPLFSWVWVKLTKTPFNPSGAVKFAMGLFFLGAGFYALVIGSSGIAQGAESAKVSMLWLTLAYMLHTAGELCVSPVGLSFVNKLSPKRLLGIMFGVWFAASAVANLIGGYMAGAMDKIAANSSMSGFFMIFVGISVGAGLVLLLISKPLSRLMHGVE